MKRQGISNPGLSNRKLLDPQDRCSLGHSVMILFSHTAKIYCRDWSVTESKEILAATITPLKC